MADEQVTAVRFRIFNPVSGDTVGTTIPVDGSVNWSLGGAITVTLTVPGHNPISVGGNATGPDTWDAQFNNAPTGTGASIEATWTAGSPPWPLVDDLTIQ
jgi:hypothetical protein